MLKDKFNSSNGFLWNLLDIISKFVVPVVVALVVYHQTISIANLEKTFKEKEAKLQEANFHDTIELKLVELVWESLNKGDEKEQTRALRLVENLQPDLRIKLARVVEYEKRYSPELKKIASEIQAGAAREILKDYKIDIYFDNHNKELADNITTFIKEKVRSVVTVNKSYKWLKRVGLPLNSTFEIRYESAYEKYAATELQTLLKQHYPKYDFTLRPVITKTPGTISLIVFNSKTIK